jgi:antitoxin MazE
MGIHACLLSPCDPPVSTNVDTGGSPKRVQVRQWGNSALVRIPAVVMAAAALTVDQSVEVRAERGRIIIEPVKAPVYDLDTPLDRMTPETSHQEIDFGPPVGQGTW